MVARPCGERSIRVRRGEVAAGCSVRLRSPALPLRLSPAVPAYPTRGPADHPTPVIPSGAGRSPAESRDLPNEAGASRGCVLPCAGGCSSARPRLRPVNQTRPESETTAEKVPSRTPSHGSRVLGARPEGYASTRVYVRPGGVPRRLPRSPAPLPGRPGSSSRPHVLTPTARRVRQAGWEGACSRRQPRSSCRGAWPGRGPCRRPRAGRLPWCRSQGRWPHRCSRSDGALP